MLSLSVGIMLSTSLLHALPDAFESKVDPRSLFATLLAGFSALYVWMMAIRIRAGRLERLREDEIE